MRKPDDRRISASTAMALAASIERWFAVAARRLPWRDDPSPYNIWISEIMAQQTRLETVVPYFRRFVARYPSAGALAAAPIDDVLALWSGLGYYSRARNMHRCAREIVDCHGGELPEDVDDLRAMPGIGAYTAGAIASIAFRKRVPLLDGNVTRLLCRLFDIGGNIALPSTRRALLALAGQLVARADPRKLNQGLMELGALVCLPRQPGCRNCPVRQRCQALKAGTVSRLPEKTRKNPPRPVRVCAALLRRPDGALLFVKNPYTGVFAGLWSLPQHPRLLDRRTAVGSRAELSRALANSLGVPVSIDEQLGMVKHTLTHRALTVKVYAGTLGHERLKLRGYLSARWVRPHQNLSRLALSTLTRKILRLGTP